MAKYHVTAPNGHVYEITAPDDASEQDVMSHLQSQIGAPGPRPLTDSESKQGFAIQMAQGVAPGFGDEALAALGNPLSAARAAFGAEPQSGDYYQELKNIRNLDERYRAENPVKSFATNVVAGLPTVLATGGAGVLKAAPTMLGRIGSAAATGAAWGGVAGFGSGEGGIEDRLQSAGYGAALGAGIGAGFQSLSPFAQPIYRALKAGATDLWDSTRNTLTQRGRVEAVRAGIPKDQLDNIGVELGQAFAAEQSKALNPQQALARAKAQSLPVPVPLRTGQITGDPALQLRENRALQGSLGQRLQGEMQVSQDEIAGALRGNVGALQGEIAGETAPLALNEGGAAAQRALVRRNETIGAKVSSLYDSARKGGDAGIRQDAWQNATQDIRAEVAGNFRPENIPKVSAVLDGLFGTANRQGEVTPLVSKVFQARRELTALQAEQGVEAVAAKQANRAIDNWLARIDKSELTGDPRAIQRWSDAITARRTQGKKYGFGAVADLIERDPRAGWRLAYAPEEVSNKLLGQTARGMAANGGLVRDLAQIKARLGSDSQGWRGLRQDMFLRLTGASEGEVLHGGGRTFSAAKLVKAWGDLKEKNPRLVGFLFNEKERRIMERLVEVSSMTIPKEGGRQLGSAASLHQAAKDIFPFLGRLGSMVAESAPARGILELPARSAVRQSIQGTIPSARLTSGARNAVTAQGGRRAGEN